MSDRLMQGVRVDRFDKILCLRGEIEQLKTDKAKLRAENATFDRRITELCDLIDEMRTHGPSQIMCALANPAIPIRCLTMDDILLVVSDCFKVSRLDIISDRRFTPLLFPRQVVMYLAYKHSKCSTITIGKKLGGRDHTTVLHGRNKIAKLISTDTTTAEQIKFLEGRLGVGA